MVEVASEQHDHRLVRYEKRAEREAALALLYPDGIQHVPLSCDLPANEPCHVKCSCQIQAGYVGWKLETA